MADVTLFNPETGAPVPVSHDAATEAVASGKLTPQKTQKIPIRLADGRHWEIEGQELHEAIANGAQIVDPEVARHERLVQEEKNRGLAGAYVAGPMQAFSGATGGLGPGLVRKGISAISPSAGKKFGEMVEVQQEAHPISSMAYNVAGAAGAAYASKGESLAGATRLAPAAIIDAAGAGVEHTVAKAIAGLGGEGLAATSARAAATAGARAGTEGAMFAAGSHIGEQALGDHELAADKLFVATAQGGVLGLGLGSILGGAGGAWKHARAASKGASSLLSDTASHGAEAATEAVTLAEAKLSAAKDAEATARAARQQPMQVGPSSLHNPEAYPSPHSVEPIDVNSTWYDKNGQRLPMEAPEAQSPFKFTKERQAVAADPLAGLSSAQHENNIGPIDLTEAPVRGGDSRAARRAAMDSAMTGEAPPAHLRGGLEAELGSGFSEGHGAPDATDVFGLRKGYSVGLKSGIEGVEAVKPGSPIKIRTDKAQEAANDAMRFGRPIENPAAVAAHEDAIAAVKAAQKEADAAAQMTQEVDQLHDAASYAKKNDLHTRAANYAWDAVGANKPLTAKVNLRGGTQRRGATMLREGIIDVNAEKGAVGAAVDSLSSNTPEQMLERTRAKLLEYGEKLGSIGAIDTHLTVRDVVRPIDEQIAELGRNAATVEKAHALLAFRNNLLSGPLTVVDGQAMPGVARSLDSKMSLSELVQQRQKLQQKTFAVGDPNATVAKVADQNIGRAWGELEEAALDKLAAQKGSSVNGQVFKDTKTTFSDLKDIEKALEGKIAGNSARASHGLLDRISGLAGGAIGGAAVPVAGHAIGHVAGTLMSKAARERGNAAAAVALTKIADIGFVKQMMSTVDRAVGGAAKGLTTTAEKPKIRVVGGSARRAERESPSETAPLATRYRDATKKLDAMNNQHSSVAERAMESTKDLSQHAPNTANAFAIAMARAASFLNSKRPQPLVEQDLYTNKEPSILDTDKRSFLAYFKATTDPMSVLKDFERGVVTPEATEALKATAPKLFQELQEKTMSEVAMRRAAGTPMPYKKRMMLGNLFDIPTDPSLDPANYKLLQANVSQPTDPVQPKSSGGKSNAPRRPVKLTNPLSRWDQIAEHGAGSRK